MVAMSKELTQNNSINGENSGSSSHVSMLQRNGYGAASPLYDLTSSQTKEINNSLSSEYSSSYPCTLGSAIRSTNPYYTQPQQSVAASSLSNHQQNNWSPNSRTPPHSSPYIPSPKSEIPSPTERKPSSQELEVLMTHQAYPQPRPYIFATGYNGQATPGQDGSTATNNLMVLQSAQTTVSLDDSVYRSASVYHPQVPPEHTVQQPYNQPLNFIPQQASQLHPIDPAVYDRNNTVAKGAMYNGVVAHTDFTTGGPSIIPGHYTTYHSFDPTHQISSQIDGGSESEELFNYMQHQHQANLAYNTVGHHHHLSSNEIENYYDHVSQQRQAMSVDSYTMSEGLYSGSGRSLKRENGSSSERGTGSCALADHELIGMTVRDLNRKLRGMK